MQIIRPSEPGTGTYDRGSFREAVSSLATVKTKMDCSTIIVSYNTFELTRDAVISAFESGRSIQHEILVVDNASPDDSGRRLNEAFCSEEFSELRLQVIALPDNVGFARANNIGAERSTGRNLFFLNPDTLVRADAIPRIVEYLDGNPDAGAVGPRVLEVDGSDQPSTRRFWTARELLRHYLPVNSISSLSLRRKDPILSQSQPVEIVHGCALAVRRSAFESIGGWNEEYFMYSEEDELCWALHHSGHTNYFLREAEITHFGGRSTEHAHAEFQVMERRSALQFLRRHGGRGLIILNRVAGAVGFGARAIAFRALEQVRPGEAADYRQRREAASALWRWFVFDYK